MASNGSELSGGTVHVTGEIVRRETPEHRDRSIVSGDGMKSQEPGGEPESARGAPAPSQVAHDHRRACDAMQLVQHDGDVVVLEMMQQLGTDHDVHAVVGKRKLSSIGARTGIEELSANAGQRLRLVDTKGGETHIVHRGRMPDHACDPFASYTNWNENGLRAIGAIRIPGNDTTIAIVIASADRVFEESHPEVCFTLVGANLRSGFKRPTP